jgi:hypothetical protein
MIVDGILLQHFIVDFDGDGHRSSFLMLLDISRHVFVDCIIFILEQWRWNYDRDRKTMMESINYKLFELPPQ